MAMPLALALSLPTEAAAKRKINYPENPEVLVCPTSSGDLDYAFYTVMERAEFQEYSSGGLYSWRRRVDGPFHLLSFENAQYFHVEFKRFRTAEGTRIVAELWWQTSSHEFGVEQQELYDVVQRLLDGLQGLYPCP